MDPRKKADWRKYLLIFLVTALLFGAGVVLGTMFASKKVSTLTALQDDLRTNTLDIETQFAIAEQDPCTFVNTSTLADQLYEIGTKLDYLESMLGKDDEYVLRLKKYYSILEVREWLFERKVREECTVKKDLILYFYSREESACPTCEEQGFILSYLRKKYDTTLRIYSFAKDIDSEAIKLLVRQYRITAAPGIVINGAPLLGFQTTDEIEALLNTGPPAQNERLTSAAE